MNVVMARAFSVLTPPAARGCPLLRRHLCSSSMWARAGMGSACVRAGERSSSEGQLKDADAVSVPIVQTNCYHFDSSEHVIAFHAGEYVSHRYGRYGSPTAKALEQKIARLDDAEACVVSASGMATATSMMLALVPPNGRVVMTSDCYHNTRKLVEHLVSMGTRLAVVEPGDYEALERELDVGADLFFTESPTNPLLRCVDVPRASALCRARGTLFCVDSTFATPINQQPLQLGADIVVHSLTKYLGGHNDVMGGSLSASAEIVDKVRKTHGLLGGVLEPQSAYLLLRGMKTLHVRVERQNETARALARALEKMDGVTAVHYPGLPSHPDHEVARTQMRGHGGVVSFEIDGGLHAAARFVDALQIPMRTASFGGVDSLVQQPTIMAYWKHTPAERAQLGLRDGLIRFSCGLEDASDLLSDVEAAVRTATAHGDAQYLTESYEDWKADPLMEALS